MNALLDHYEQDIEEIVLRLQDGRSYMDRVSEQSNVFEEIQKEEIQIQELRKLMIERTSSKQFVLSKLRAKETTFIFDHTLFVSAKLQELTYPTPLDPENEQQISEWVTINHEIGVKIVIREIFPLTRGWGNLQNEISFDALRFHLHHIDKSAVSEIMHYHPRHNLYHRREMVNGKLMKSRRGVSLTIKHQITAQNQILYQEMLGKEKIYLVAQTTFGSIVGFAEVDLSELPWSGNQIKGKKIVFQFKKKYPENGYSQDCPPLFFANSQFSIQSSPIAPQLSELTLNSEFLSRYRSNSRSPSPNRVISKSPVKRSHSAKGKRVLLGAVLKGDSLIRLIVFEGREYRIRVQGINQTSSKELIYKKVDNVNQKKIELVKIQSNYFLKIKITKDAAEKPSQVLFNFNAASYSVKVVENSFFQFLELPEYQLLCKNQKEKRISFRNKVIHLGEGNCIYAAEQSRIFKNISKQEIQEGLLATVCVKSPLRDCEIFCCRPFRIYQIVRKEEGYFITYFYQQRLASKEQKTSLVLYLRDTRQNIFETHIFECLVKERILERQTIVREVFAVRGETFLSLSLKMIANQNYQYQVRSTDMDRIAVVNGASFRYQNIINENLVLQLLQFSQILKTDLIFFDNKDRSFFIRLTVRRANKLDQ